MAEGIGAVALHQGRGRQGITDAHLPAGPGQGQGRQGTGGTGPQHLGPENRIGMDHGDRLISPGGSTKKPQLIHCGSSWNWAGIHLGSADAKQAAGEGFATQGKFGDQQGNEAEHGHAAV